MSLLVRAALLGGLAYVVSRALKARRDSPYLSQTDAPRLSRYRQRDETLPTSDSSFDEPPVAEKFGA